MSLSKARELREKRAKLVDDAQKLIPADGVLMTAEVRTNFDRMMGDAEAMKGDIDRIERAEALNAETRETRRPPEGDPAGGNVDKAAAVAEFRTALKRGGLKGAESIRPESRRVVEDLHEQYFRAFRDYLVRGESKMSDESRAIMLGRAPEFRDLGVGTGSLGGFFVPQGFVYKIEEAMKWFGDMLNVAEIMDTATGQPLPYPTDNDTTNTGEIIGENQQVTVADVSIGHITLGAYKFSTKMVKVSIELLQDSAFDIESWLQRKFGIRLGRIINTKMTVGAGTTEPNGIVTAVVANNGSPVAAASIATGTPLIAAGSSANTGGAETGTTSIGSADLQNLEHTVDRAYRRGSKYMMHDLTLRFVKTLLDKYGRPLWTPGLANNAPDMINGYSYSINNDMAQIAASAVTVLFGPLDKYLIRRVKELAVLRLSERFADYGQVAFLGFARYDGNLIDAGTHPVSYLIQHS
jgi:HK97 family phage major capsid protein